jgi:hypothetical protein
MKLNKEDYNQLASMILDRGEETQYLFMYKDGEELDLDYIAEMFGYIDETGVYIYTGIDLRIHRVRSFDMECGEDTITTLDENELQKKIEQLAGLD